MTRIKKAIISVSDKEGIVDFAHKLIGWGVEIFSTGGTQRLLESNGLKVTSIAQLVEFPEILDGRVKTLHPRIYGGILARRDYPAHTQQLVEHGISFIDMVVVNLYPFREIVQQEGTTLETALENIDIGGVSLIRAAAKNFVAVIVVTSPDDYSRLISEMEDNAGTISWETRAYLAQKAFAHTASYDSLICQYLSHYVSQKKPYSLPPIGSLPWQGESQDLLLHYEKIQELRYGENPHQKGCWYREIFSPDNTLASTKQLQGKDLSFNNILDTDAAMRILTDFPEITAVIIKHNNPCGVGCGASPAEAYRLARECDPMSAYGGIVGFNRPLDVADAQGLMNGFLEVVVAPGYTPEALEILKTKTNLRVLEIAFGQINNEKKVPVSLQWELKKVLGGILVQEGDDLVWEEGTLRVVTKRQPTSTEKEALFFAWRVAKHVKSNAIVIAKSNQTIGIGAGQMSRIDAVKLAITKACLPLKGTVLASDGFFPFRDSIDLAAQAGVTAIVQPGGSVRDAEVIAAADQHNIAMLFTGYRHFRH